MSREVATFEAKCRKCLSTFAYPSFSDFAYGESILFSKNGKRRAWVNAFSEFPQKIGNLLSTDDASKFWNVLAYLTDDLEGQRLTSQLVCKRSIPRTLPPNDVFCYALMVVA
jgi:hypothetical protein